MSQLVVIDEVLATEDNPEHPLPRTSAGIKYSIHSERR
jgi:hypothetical protein